MTIFRDQPHVGTVPRRGRVRNRFYSRVSVELCHGGKHVVIDTRGERKLCLVDSRREAQRVLSWLNKGPVV